MTSTEWEPFGLNDEERARYAVLIDGVRPQMRESLIAWINDRLRYSGASNDWVNRGQCLDVQAALDLALGVPAGPGTITEGLPLRKALRSIGDVQILRVADYLLSKQNLYDVKKPSGVPLELETILSRSRSKWTIGLRHDKPGLTERVPAGVQDTVEGVIESSGTAGRLLAKAWADVHGVEPTTARPT